MSVQNFLKSVIQKKSRVVDSLLSYLPDLHGNTLSNNGAMRPDADHQDSQPSMMMASMGRYRPGSGGSRPSRPQSPPRQ